MTSADSHAAHIAHLTANAGRIRANHRKSTRTLTLRNWLTLFGGVGPHALGNRAGFATTTGFSLYAMDRAETDRPTVLSIDTVDDAYAVMELAAAFINGQQRRSATQGATVDPEAGEYDGAVNDEAEWAQISIHPHPHMTNKGARPSRPMTLHRRTLEIVRALLVSGTRDTGATR